MEKLEMARYLRIVTTEFFLCVLMLSSSLASAQAPTGTISGRVTDQNGGLITGASVSIESPNLQGVSTTTTTGNGDYIFRALPPGRYTVTVDVRGFATSKRTVDLAATQPVSLDVTLRPATVTEVVNVVDESPNFFLKAIPSATNLKAPLLDGLPTARTMLSAADLSPAVHATGPSGARSISGAMSFESSYLLNGVSVQDNIRGTPFSLFIEDAIQETTTTSSGVSAEYGRFLGGVINTVTKSGGNMLSGSFRTSFTNDNWRTTSPFGEPKTDTTVPTYEFTIGGPVVQNRTWFFGAGRVFDQTLGRETGETRVPYDFNASEQRYEGKITQSLGSSRRLQFGFTGIERTEENNAYPSVNEVIDVKSLTSRDLPQRLWSLNYTGAVSPSFFIETQASARSFRFVGAGGKNTDLIQGTPLIDNSTNEWWWAPSFCGVCGDEHRDNVNFFAKGSYFKSTGLGAHNVTFGYDLYNDIRKGDNRQSATDFHVYTTSHLVEGGVIYPVIEPGFSTFVVHWPLTEASKGTSFRTHSLFFNDEWAANQHLSLTLGLRWDKNHGRDHGRNLIADDSMLSPRLGVVFDPKGDGRTTINASFSRYVAALAGSVAEGASPAGTPSILAYAYFGDPINDNPNGPLVPSDAALQRVFDWYNSVNPNDYIVQATIPGVAVKIQDSLKSPHADEFAVGLSQQIGSRGAVRFDLVHRKFSDFYADRIDTTTGQVFDEFGQEFDLQLIENTNVTKRTYKAFNAQGSFRPSDDLDLGISYSLSFLRGNVNGENIGSGPIATSVLLYPEYRDLAWFAPEGYLSADQRHRARLWWLYTLPFSGDRYTMSVGMIEQLQSGTPYGAAGVITMFDEHGPFVQNPGYAVEPFTQSYWFTNRDEFRTAAMYRTDLSFNVQRRFGAQRPAQLFAQFQVLNVFNQFSLFNLTDAAINTTVLTANDDPDRFVPFNPFTDTPVRGTHWDFGDRFGKATGAGAYTTPRTYQFSLGLKF
jgi:hypothetical protein